MPVFNPRPHFLQEAIRSVRQQVYENWELCVADDASSDEAVRDVLESNMATDSRIKVVHRKSRGDVSAALNSALKLARGKFVAFLDHHDVLAANALYEIARASISFPEVDLFYSDEDQIDADGARFRPHFKPDWNLLLFLAQNYVNHLTAIRRSAIEEIGGFRQGYEGSQDHDLILRVLGANPKPRIHHISRILYHWRNIDAHGAKSIASSGQTADARRKCVREYLARTGVDAEVITGSGGYNRVVRQLPEPAPLVTLVVPTRDKFKLIRNCIESLLKTNYPNFEILIVDNNSRCRKTLAYLRELTARPRLRVIEYDRPFNFSAINNFAAAQSRGEYLAFINNDVEAMDDCWLSEMMSHAVLPEIGAVGCKLIYGDHRIQHAGVILGLGRAKVAGHSHKFFNSKLSGYFHRPHLHQYISAVTGACMLTSKTKFELVGGFDDVNLAVAFNDVDLCLKLRQEGFLNVYTPHAVLYHHESMSRGRDAKGQRAQRFAREAEYMRAKWKDLLTNDPYYNRNLSLDGEDFRLRK